MLSRDRARLGALAAGLYPEVPRVGSTDLLCREEWVAAAPIPLESVRLGWKAEAAPAAVKGMEAAGFPSYSEAMAALGAPAVFEDRPCYRLVEADARALGFSGASYFQGVDIGEAVAHELAAEVEGLPLRSLVGDPCDLTRRTALPAITTVTIRRGDSPRYVSHWRDPAKVAHAGGLYQVMPVGVFQPVVDERADLDLWRCMAREFSEEFLGTSEDYGPGFSYETWPFFQKLQAGRESGRLRVYFLGLGVDPLSLAVDLLTVAVFEEELFDELFQGLVDVNAEGRVEMAPFTGEPRVPMQAAGAAALELAWRFREALL